MKPNYDIFDARALLSFPDGDNSTDSLIGDVHFNTTTLDHWNYTLYDNGTISNGSRCWLTFAPYEPVFLRTNGSFVNATKCYSAIEPIGTRGFTGLGFAVAFGLGLVLTITTLAKHGPSYLPHDRRFYPIGRRWQWYWACFVSACALISLFTNVDVDRYYLQELPIIVTTFFWFLMCMGTLALTWEAVRHWGSWQERQYIDPNPFVYDQDDKRAKIEFWLPLWAYFWIWMNFFLVVPRDWNFAKMQRSPEQALSIAAPSATSVRFKAAGFCLVIAWLTICFSLRHSIAHYKPRNRGIFNRTIGFVQAIPFRFILIIPLTLAMVAYQIFISFVWEYSVMKYDGCVPIIYGWGYGPSLVIIYIQVLYGYFTPNEDKELYRQRRERGELVDRELGLVKKPAWWRRVRGDHLHSLRDKIGMNVREVGGVEGVGRREEDLVERSAREEARSHARGEADIELTNLRRGSNNNALEYNPRADRAGARLLSRDDSLVEPSPPPPYQDAQRSGRDERGIQRSNSTSTTGSISAPPQQIRSMLDI